MKELSKAYEPQQYEDNMYKRWEESGFFNPDVCVEKGICKKDAEHFSVVLPPPNITAQLHLGHVVMVAITDILARYHRMNGKRVLWIPGTDHAALATQNVVEKKLMKEKNQTRHDLGRETFLKEVDDFVSKTQTTIIKQLHKTGASMDWSRLAFTLDEQRQKAVRQMFVDMYNEGVIYRGFRMVNWCPRCQSTLSDDEVEYKEQEAKLYTFKYSKDFPLSISTTRPETKLGDTAVAVNPKDKRYKKYIGQIFQVDFCGVPLSIKIIADENVDMDFGTGALGVTPAHSFVDYEMAQKNALEVKKIIEETGKMQDVGAYSGLSVLEVREAVVVELHNRGLLEKEEEMTNNLSICSRCGTAIEPLPSKQWFVAVDKKLDRLGGKSLKERALEVAQDNSITFTPERFKKRYTDWMENLHDWCISRQIWYGHRIPVWYKKGDEGRGTRDEDAYVGVNPPEDIENWEQENDVLDTWFSSGMWTFSTMGWPDNFKNGKKMGDLAGYHPTQILETGYEIITLWVSRMIMMSLFALNEIPFENVYLHGMVLDKDGKKMSKSKGNGIDPLEMIEKYGTDATRLSLIIGNTPGNDSRMSEEKIADYRNFTNKLWNISRFMLMNMGERVTSNEGRVEAKTLADKWILGRLMIVSKQVTDNIEKYNFSFAGEQLRDFTWNELADWYLEIAKIEGNKSEMLNYILNTILKLWHPFMPFVTEAIWGEVYGNERMLMVEKWPLSVIPTEPEGRVEESLVQFQTIQKIITGIRSIRAENKIEPAKKLNVMMSAGDTVTLLQENAEVIKGLARLESLIIEEKTEKPANAIGFVESGVEVFISLEGVLDVAKEKERLTKEIAQLKGYVAGLEKKLSNKEFVNNAPAEVVEKEKAKLEEGKSKLEKLEGQFKQIN